MDGRRARALLVIAGLWMLAACSTNSLGGTGGGGGAGGASHARPESAEARAVVARVRAMKFAPMTQPPGVRGMPEPEMPRDVLPAASATRIDREGGRFIARVPAIPAGSTARPADVWLGATAGDGFRVEDRGTKMAIDVRPLLAEEGARRAEGEVVEGYVVYRGGGLRAADVIHRVTAEGTEDFVAFERKPATEELAYVVTLSGEVAGLRLVSNTLEVLDAAGTPRLRMAPPYLASADGTRRDARVSVEGCAYEVEPGRLSARRVTPPGAGRCTVRVAWGDGGVRYPAIVDPAWTTTGSMATARIAPTASRLPDGKVLVVGGYNGASLGLASAELYDPVAKTWSAVGSLAAGRYSHTASTLSDGKVLVAGGSNGGGNGLASAELYDPVAQTWSAAGSMPAGRSGHTASTLSDGKVLVAGAQNGFGPAQLYDPAAKTWSAVGSLAQPRALHTASVLSDGKVLVAGGEDTSTATGWLASAELYDPAAKTWSVVGSLAIGRGIHTASVLSDGKVVVVGGYTNVGGATTTSAELYDPAAKTWSPAGILATARYAHTASVLSDGRVLIAGGSDGVGSIYPSTELYDPAGKTWAAAGSMSMARDSHAASVLSDGTVLIAGGGGTSGSLGTSEIFARTSNGSCTGLGECISGFCIDGFCCDTACGKSCDVCAASLGAIANGTCSPAAIGYAGKPSCAPYLCNGVDIGCPCASDAECGANDYCAANGTCKARTTLGSACNLAAAADCEVAGCRKCASGNCVDGFCCNTPCPGSCDVCAAALGASTDGTCTTVAAYGGNPSCSPYVCAAAGAACPSSCASDAACDATHYCDANDTCQPRKSQGLPCNTAAGADCAVGGCHACVTSHCVDGSCCDTACADACDVCSASLGASANGTCSLGIAYGGSPLCAPYVCGSNGTACPSKCAADTDCVAGNFCDQTVCKPKLANGGACATASACTSTFCADGFCCDQACTGQCEACDGATKGTCAPVKIAPHGTRPPCLASPECGGLCDGVKHDACTYPGGTKLCGANCAAGTETPKVCDGLGACKDAAPIPCAPYVCDDSTRCKTSCTTSDDCATGFGCGSDMTCAPAGATCADDHTLKTTDGKTKDCTPYTCGGTSCKEQCTSVDDCVSPSVCDGTSKQCVAPKGGKAGPATSGCGCRVADEPAGGSWVVAVAIGAAFTRRRRRTAGANWAASRSRGAAETWSKNTPRARISVLR